MSNFFFSCRKNSSEKAEHMSYRRRASYTRPQQRRKTMNQNQAQYYKPEPRTEGKWNIIRGLLQEYNIESAAGIQEALKDLLGGTIKAMMEA